jgi:glycerol uptake facilitator protein
MNIFLGELIGSFLLILIGNGVVANVVLNKTKGNNSGWIVITIGWSMAVFVAVFVASKFSGAHLNPAVTVGMVIMKKIPSADLAPYFGGQFIGCLAGAFFNWVAYKQHFDETENQRYQLASFCTSPSIPNTLANLTTEIIATFVLVLGVFFIISPDPTLGSIDALPVAFLVLAIGLGLGGPTGFAINPFRDLCPRIMHSILPISNKGSSNWGYAWIPVVGPFIGGILAALVFKLLP